MNESKSSRILRYGIAGSLAVHLIFAACVRSHRVEAAVEPPPTRGEIIHIVSTPTPRPVQTPPPQPHREPSRRAPSVRPPRLTSHPAKDAATANRAPQNVASAIPGPAVTDGPIVPVASSVPAITAAPVTPEPTPVCTEADRPAHTLTTAQADVPESLRDEGVTGQTEIEVRLSASGEVIDATVYRSSGYGALDRVALRAALASHYAAEQRNCEFEPGSYLFTVNFE